jgi:RimJ/RimL family protein N-acetyltransferase
MLETKLPPRAISAVAVDPLPCLRPAAAPLVGTTVRLEPLDPQQHAEGLFAAGHEGEAAQRIWDYLNYGPFADVAAYTVWLRNAAAEADPLFFVVRDHASNRLGGVISYLNIMPKSGSIEIGHIWLAPFLQNSRQGSEALYLSMEHAFALGYRRLEWKCNAQNEASRRAAVRLGFAYEGTFYQHMITKGRNRDTAWFSILDYEWPLIQANFRQWLADENFDQAGKARTSLGELNRRLRIGAMSEE